MKRHRNEPITNSSHWILILSQCIFIQIFNSLFVCFVFLVISWSLLVLVYSTLRKYTTGRIIYSAACVSIGTHSADTRGHLSLQYLAFTCGLVRGALSNLGVKSIVTAEVSVMPGCKTCIALYHPQTLLSQPHHMHSI